MVVRRRQDRAGHGANQGLGTGGGRWARPRLGHCNAYLTRRDRQRVQAAATVCDETPVPDKHTRCPQAPGRASRSRHGEHDSVIVNIAQGCRRPPDRHRDAATATAPGLDADPGGLGRRRLADWLGTPDVTVWSPVMAAPTLTRITYMYNMKLRRS